MSEMISTHEAIAKAIKSLESDGFNLIRGSYFESADGLYGLRDALHHAIKQTDGTTKETLEEVLAEVSHITEKLNALGLGEWI